MFGMGTGGSLRLLSPETKQSLDSLAAARSLAGSRNFIRTLKTAQVRFHFALSDHDAASLLASTFFLKSSSLDQALDRLVSPSSIHCCTSTDDLSTLSSSRGLTCSRSGNLLLEVGFTLRCLQRLSRPHFASLLCRWHDNSCTSGASIPVLSY